MVSSIRISLVKPVGISSGKFLWSVVENCIYFSVLSCHIELINLLQIPLRQTTGTLTWLKRISNRHASLKALLLVCIKNLCNKGIIDMDLSECILVQLDLDSARFGFITCAWLQCGLEKRIQKIGDVGKMDCKACNSDDVILAFCWFPESSGLLSIKTCLARYGCKLTSFHLLRFYTFFPQKSPREICTQIVAQKLHISKSNLITKFKSLPAFNIHLLAFPLHRLSTFLEFTSVPATHMYPPTAIPGVPHCHPIRWPLIPRRARISFGLASRQIRHANIRLCNIWRFKLQPHQEKITQETWFGIWIKNY